jgi:outer membrane cobalamin receptor
MHRSAAVALLVFGPSVLRAEEATARHGVVRDPSGAPIEGAAVELRSEGRLLARVVTAPDGSFVVDTAGVRAGTIVVTAEGFTRGEQTWSSTDVEPLAIVLDRTRLREDVTVTAARGETRLGDTAARITVLDAAELEATAAPTLDDALRQVPGFTLFRRTGSRVANPTSQGASMRGVGASGASRTLVLVDGLPLNDPFGGWVYWSRVPRVAVERVEVMEGGASDLYGSAALGGVIQALERSDAPALAAELSGGTQGTGGISAYGGVRPGAWSVRASGEAFTTDGYVLVPEDARGPVDTEAGSEHLAGRVVLERRLRPGATLFVRGAVFGESRTNGTPLQTNDTDEQEVAAGADLPLAKGTLHARGFYATQTYHQTFTAISADRTSESLTRRQRVPAEAVGGSAQWARALGSRNALTVGFEARRVEGRSDETPYVGGRPLALVSAGGVDRTVAGYAADRIAIGSRTLLTVGARVDSWSGGAQDTTEVSPRASVLFRATPQLVLTGSGYGAFRSPTLNELYRGFRVGNTVTQANAALVPERLRGGEAGAAWSRSDGRLRLRAVGFAARIDDPIANVTLSSTPQLITRQRQNLGRNRSLGVEVDAEGRIDAHTTARLGYGFTDATVRSFSADPTLVGNDVPQVARHQLTFGVRFDSPRLFELSLQGRVSSRQFEDDQNLLVLPGYFTLDAQISRRVKRVRAFAALENVTGERYAVGLTPTPTEGPPFGVRFGIRFE